MLVDEPSALQWLVLPNYQSSDHDVDSGLIVRPRINKPQVLDDYSWLPDGFVYEFLFIDTIARSLWNGNNLLEEPYRDYNEILYVVVLGVRAGYTVWGEHHGMEVIET